MVAWWGNLSSSSNNNNSTTNTKTVPSNAQGQDMDMVRVARLTRMRTRLPLRSTSVMESLLARDMIAAVRCANV